MYLGRFDNGRVQRCSHCGNFLLNPGCHRSSMICCGISQQWWKYDYRDVVAIQDDNRRWRIWMLGADGTTPDREFAQFNRGRGYAHVQGAKRAWDRAH